MLAVQTSDQTPQSFTDSIHELRDLAASVGCQVVGEMFQIRAKIDPGTFIGSGKLEEARAEVLTCGADLVIFDNNLSPSQGERVEKALKVMVMDRTQLILEIFRRNARTHQARLQVELAQLEYMLPRLVGMWAHLDRERGGIGGSKGAGEKQIDIDRSLIRHRIAKLKKELLHVDQERRTQKKRRTNCFQVSLVGYTNAGKSTLMNRLTDADVLVENRLFATLDSTTRVMLKDFQPRILLSDTVGFIKQLPHELVASFQSTLEVARDADLLLHVVDLSHEASEEHIQTTETVLEEIGADTIPRLLVFNKVDLVNDRVALALARRRWPNAFFTSALADDIEPLRHKIAQFFEKAMITAPVLLRYTEYGELSKIYEWSRVDAVRYEPDGIHLTITSTPANLERLRALVPLEESNLAETA
ncbi:MAG TPA: GTPase HflX [bacterium]